MHPLSGGWCVIMALALAAAGCSTEAAAGGGAVGAVDSGGSADGNVLADGGSGADGASGSDSTAGADTATAGDTTANAACLQASDFLDLSSAAGAGSSYAKPTLSAACDGDEVVIKSNTIPHYTFVPMTPNALKVVDNTYRFPRNPKVAAATTAIPLLGGIGVAVNGMPLFGPNEGAQPAESAFGDPVYNQITDECTGHTANEYHYHALRQKCLTAASMVAEPWKLADVDPTKASPVLGYGLDGFAIYGPYECKDKACSGVIEMKSGYEAVADPKKDAWNAYQHKVSTDAAILDACNGHTGPNGDYHYHATTGFPYILGCFAGTATGAGAEAGRGGGGGGTPPGGDGGTPPGGGGQPTACTTEADCGGSACPAAATKGCTCGQTPNGKACIPKCSTTADCPQGGPMTLQCTAQGFCAPGQ